jgi:hypothetical protein
MKGKDDDVGFSFDPEPFKSGLKEVTSGLDRLEKTTANVGAKMSGAVFKAVAAVKVAGAMVKGFISTVREQVPEIGMAFGIAKEIALKNFLWPLRQALAPFLQKMLDWVRDHRVLFVKWGQVVANAFTVVMGIAKNLWGVFKSLFDVLWTVIKRFVGGGGFDNAITLFLGKVAIAGEFIKGIFDNIVHNKDFLDFVNGLADLIKGALDLVLGILKAFGKGVAESSLMDAMTPINGIVSALNGLFKSLNDLMKVGGGDGFFTWIGRNFGNSIQQSLLTVAYAIEIVVDALQWLIEAIKSVTALAAGKSLEDIGESMKALAGQQAARWKPLLVSQGGVINNQMENVLGKQGYVDLKKAFEDIGKSFAKGIKIEAAPTYSGDERKAESYKNVYGKYPSWWDSVNKVKVNDAIIQKGKVIEIASDDIITAKKGSTVVSGKDRSGGRSVSFGPMNISLTVTEGSARQAGENFADGYTSRFRNNILDSLVAEGGR